MTSLQLDVCQVNPRYVDDAYARHRGLYPNNPSGTTGALVPIELQWKPTPAGLPGSYKIGAWYDTSNASDLFLDTAWQPIARTGGAPLQRGSRSGVYLNFQQQVTGRAEGRGAGVFLNVTQSDRSTAASMDRQLALGMTYRGLFPDLPQDVIGVAIGSNHVNGRVADGVRLTNQTRGGRQPLPGSESVGEAFYSWASLRYFSLQPNVQYIRHPGGVGSNESVLVFGVRSSVDF